MRFYVPEWEDHVDAEYDFATDEHSSITRSERNLAYIWDVFDRDPTETPIDGILISREQIEESPERARRLKEYGVYDAPDDGTTLAVPEWLPTISDCGAWGYKELPFPPYGNEEMLSFYENLNVDIGVTIDHLVLGSGHAARLYLNETAFPDDFGETDLPDVITDHIDVMIDEWPEPESWPDYVESHEPSITKVGPAEMPADRLFEIALGEIDPEEEADEVKRRVKTYLRNIADDPRIVYRDDDMQFRYDLTLENLRQMREYYESGDYSFRLMCAIQGWDTASYANATRAALAAGYNYLGIGGVAGSQEDAVKRYVSAVGEVVKDYERAHETRVDTHVFGFAKTGAFDTIGRSGMSSFDSASMLRAAWTGGENYHLDTPGQRRRYDALRVRYPGHAGDLTDAIETALWSQEILTALRAYDRGNALTDAIETWHTEAKRSLAALEGHLAENRWKEPYNQHRIRDLKEAFRTEYEYGREVKANFSDRFRKAIIKLLRDDNPDNPKDFDEYLEVIQKAEESLEQFPQTVDRINYQLERGVPECSFGTVWTVVEAYTEFTGDEDHRDGYRSLLRDRAWEDCSCPVCTSLGIDVAIFRGNNRNRRRGFHNTRRFYDQFEHELPKLLVLTKGGTSLTPRQPVEDFLSEHRSHFWKHVHDLPVAEVGVVTAEGVHEWWDQPPETLSFAPHKLKEQLVEQCGRYQAIYIDGANWDTSKEMQTALESAGCDVWVFETPADLRAAVLDRLDYDERTIPPHPEREKANQVGLTDF
ncbi:queuine tRNA-ribosyltransferase tRNA-guanine transglycosylase [Salinibaculum rarum]|uniref:queuine tRNA-ribosyltransferase tRNA-guanine transglycosylase n=1 Tax=Salinibaculum rarum TaxID=3058903 RepID=UPI00265DD73E|nr:queuine tRNA-ribosyltransferase tRNA-guanine transglycosylase [Salinibaculum sp. KK48]